VDLDLQLAPIDEPGTSRRPDLVVVTEAEFNRVEVEGGLLRAVATTLVVEIISSGSRRTDTVIKRGEYADAGIAHYWIIDLARPTSLLAAQLAGEFGYQDSGEVTGTFRTNRSRCASTSTCSAEQSCAGCGPSSGGAAPATSLSARGAARISSLWGNARTIRLGATPS
jgi:hypothetical protein